MCGVFDKCDQDSVMVPSIYKKKETVQNRTTSSKRPKTDLVI